MYKGAQRQIVIFLPEAFFSKTLSIEKLEIFEYLHDGGSYLHMSLVVKSRNFVIRNFTFDCKIKWKYKFAFAVKFYDDNSDDDDDEVCDNNNKDSFDPFTRRLTEGWNE